VTWTREDCLALLTSDGWARYSPSSQAIMKAALRKLWELSEREDLLSFSRFWAGRSGPVDRRQYIQNHTASPEDLRVVRQHCRDMLATGTPYQAYAVFPTLLEACFGMRGVCIESMRLCDIDTDKRSLNVPKSKRGKSRPVGMIHDITREWFAFLKARTAILDAMAVGRPSKDEDGHNIVIPATEATKARVAAMRRPDAPLMFSRTEAGKETCAKPLSGDAIVCMVERVAKPLIGKSGHSLRHGVIYELLSQGWAIERVASLVGHSNLTTTYQYTALGAAEHMAEHERTSNGRAATPEATTTATNAPPTSDTQARAANLKASFKAGDLTLEEYTSKLERLLAVD
jgi:integrase